MYDLSSNLLSINRWIKKDKSPNTFSSRRVLRCHRQILSQLGTRCSLMFPIYSGALLNNSDYFKGKNSSGKEELSLIQLSNFQITSLFRVEIPGSIG
ncbi:hypothetical protein SNEBB_004482 [Seison nebaliae]|nr:hypothetical protein SNEBB_004482 [Seison nebaliae]